MKNCRKLHKFWNFSKNKLVDIGLTTGFLSRNEKIGGKLKQKTRQVRTEKNRPTILNPNPLIFGVQQMSNLPPPKITMLHSKDEPFRWVNFLLLVNFKNSLTGKLWKESFRVSCLRILGKTWIP